MPISVRPPATGQTATLPAGYRLGPITADLGDIPWGRVDEHRVEWHLLDLDGWWDAPDLAAAVTERPYGHGVWTGPGWWESRVVTLTGLVIAPSEAGRDAALERLAAACPLVPIGLLRVDSHPPTQAVVRRTASYKVSKPTVTRAQVQIQLLAPDPLRYAATATVVRLPAAGTAGVSAPVAPPVVLPAGDPRIRVAFNAGTAEAGWHAVIAGPCSGPRVSNLTTGRVLGFDLEVAAGSVLVLDGYQGTARLGGADVSTEITVGTDWWPLEKGENRLCLTTSVPAFVYAEITFRSAWS